MKRDEEYFDVHAVGIEMFHKNGNTIDRPHGSGDFVFIHFLTPVEIFLDGERLVEEPDTCIVYAPPKRQHYRNLPGGSFGNNWMHFSGRTCLRFLQSLDMPLNQPFRPADTGCIVSSLRAINDEKIRREPYWEIGMDMAIRRFFLRLARSVKQTGKKRTTAKYLETYEQMQRLRARINESCYEAWTVDRMAGEVHLSKSRFSVLYRKMFRTSPLADLLGMRMELAKYYLGMMRMPVEDVAESCGFASVYYFHRLFKKLNNITPGMFQRTYSGEDIQSQFHLSLRERRGKAAKAFKEIL